MNDPDGINQRFFVDQLVEEHMSDLNALYMDFHSRVMGTPFYGRTVMRKTQIVDSRRSG